MMIFEKAIENYAKKMRASYKNYFKLNGDELETALHGDVARFVQMIEKMTATGYCTVPCEFCPVALAKAIYPTRMNSCGIASREEKMKIIAEEYK